jgi:hypothetical protein
MGGIIRYEDQQGAVASAVGVSALTEEQYRDTGFLMAFFRHDQDDTLHLTFQFSHRKKLGTPIASVHIHCIPMVNPAIPQNVYFGYKYTWQDIGSEFPSDASWITGNATMTVGITDAFKQRAHGIVVAVPAPIGEGYSSMVLFRLQRLGTNPLDTYNTNKAGGTPAANLGLLYMDCHFQTERRGSLAQFSD